MSSPMDRSTLRARYLPCHPLEDGLGMGIVTWQETHLGITYHVTRGAVVHWGIMRNHEIQDMPLCAIEALADAYLRWAVQPERG